MTEYCRRMVNDNESDAPEKYRERRRRRIEIRRVSASQANRPDSKRLRFEESSATATASSSSDEVAETEEESVREPVFGTMSVSGRSRHMEDAISVRTGIFRPEFIRWRPVHFFSVYDGHGGPHVIILINLSKFKIKKKIK